MQDRRREEEVRPQARVELHRLAAERGDADRVLEQAAGVAMVAVRPGSGERAKRRTEVGVAEKRGHEPCKLRMGDLRGEELEEPVELVRVAAHGRDERRRIRVLGGLDRPHLELELAAEPLDASQHAHGVTLVETRVEELHVVPYAAFDAAARVGELESEVRGARTGPPALLPGDCEHALDRPVLGELRDRRHGAKSMARVRCDCALVRSP